MQLLDAFDLPVGGVSLEEMAQLKELLADAMDVFALDNSELGCTDLVQQVIDTDNHPPIKQQPHHTPVVYRERIAQMVDEMQEQGVIQPSATPWASPVVLVPKKDVSLRRLNATTKKDVYPLPCINDILDTLGESMQVLHILGSCIWVLAGGA